MQAEVVQVKCQHVQEYGDHYAGLAITQSDGSKVLLRVPMWQYDSQTTPRLLGVLAKAINVSRFVTL